MRLTGVFRPPLRPAWRHLGAALGLGAVVALGQAPFGLWFAALPALALLIRLAAVSRAGWIGFAGGFGYVLAGMFWITEPFLVEPEVYGWMAPFALTLMAAGMGVFWALGAGLGAMAGHTPARRALGVAVGLAASDALRSYIFTGFPWILFGHIWVDTPVAQLDAYSGPIGLSLFTLAVAVAPWLSGQRMRGLAVSILALALAWWLGALRLDAPEPSRATPINLRLVQPNATQALKWDPEYALPFFYRHLDLTAQAPAEGKPKPDLVIWPETAVPFLLNNPGDGLRMISEAAGGVPVALGIQRAEGARYYNSMIVLGPDAQILDTYDKVHLVPFGEYIPWGDVLAKVGISAFAARAGNGYSAGAAEQVLDLGPKLGQVEPLICYEAVFPQDIGRVKTRPDWIMQITNDAWFGTLSGPWQHLAQSRLRAIEFGLPVARAANTGVSAMIDAKGRIVAEIGMDQQGVIDVALPASLPATVYSKWGDTPALALLCVLILIILLWPRQYGVDRGFRRV